MKPEEWAAPRAIASGQAVLNEEVEIECFDGTHKTILNSAVPIFENDTIQGAIVVNQDITGHKQAERLLEQQNQDLEEMRQAENRQRQLAETLNDVSRALSQTLDFDKVLNTLAGVCHAPGAAGLCLCGGRRKRDQPDPACAARL